jgi:hypothetical protein
VLGWAVGANTPLRRQPISISLSTTAAALLLPRQHTRGQQSSEHVHRRLMLTASSMLPVASGRRWPEAGTLQFSAIVDRKEMVTSHARHGPNGHPSCCLRQIHAARAISRIMRPTGRGSRRRPWSRREICVVLPAGTTFWPCDLQPSSWLMPFSHETCRFHSWFF